VAAGEGDHALEPIHLLDAVGTPRRAGTRSRHPPSRAMPRASSCVRTWHAFMATTASDGRSAGGRRATRADPGRVNPLSLEAGNDVPISS
jgi:hypothetical protein